MVEQIDLRGAYLINRSSIVRYDLGVLYAGGEGDIDRYMGGGVEADDDDTGGVGCRWRTGVAGELCRCGVRIACVGRGITGGVARFVGEVAVVDALGLLMVCFPVDSRVVSMKQWRELTLAYPAHHIQRYIRIGEEL